MFFLLVMSGGAKAADYQNKTWLAFSASSPLTQNYRMWGQAQLRYSLEDGGIYQTFTGAGIVGSRKQDPFELGALYLYLQTENAKEHRLVFHSQYQRNLNSLNTISFRGWLEGRTWENIDEDSLRLRTQARFTRRLKKKRSLVLWNEFFFNLTEERRTGDRAFERNRFFVGLRHVFARFQTEWGYMNEYVPRQSEDAVNHILFGSLIF